MKFGYLAVNQHGDSFRLTGVKHPRKQLLDKVGCRHCRRITWWRLGPGLVKHTGYVIGGDWWTLYEVHAWENDQASSSAQV